jgi:Tat protein secretion system quality control protein TatD with DNase activity
MVGEIGLDRSFRIPYPPNPTGSTEASNTNTEDTENAIAATGPEQELAAKEDFATSKPNPKTKTLTPFTTSTSHQLQLLELQFQVALECGVNVSLHSVKSQGKLRFSVLPGRTRW